MPNRYIKDLKEIFEILKVDNILLISKNFIYIVTYDNDILKV